MTLATGPVRVHPPILWATLHVSVEQNPGYRAFADLWATLHVFVEQNPGYRTSAPSGDRQDGADGVDHVVRSIVHIGPCDSENAPTMSESFSVSFTVVVECLAVCVPSA